MQRSHTLNDIYQQHYCYCVAPLSPTVNMPLHFRLYVFCTDGRLHINYAISRYQSRIHRPCDIASSRDRMICTNSRLTRVLLAGPDQTHKQCWPAIIISGTVIWKARIYSQSATWRCHAFQHTNTCIVWSVVCTLLTNILPVQADKDGESTTAAARIELLGWPARKAIPTPAARVVSGRQTCADRTSL